MSKENLQVRLELLEQSINKLTLSSSKLALMHLHESLRLKIEKSKNISLKTDNKLNEMLQGCLHFIESIQKISKKDPLNKKEIEHDYNELVDEYQRLNRLIRGNKVVVFLKDSFHIVLASLGLAFGSALGFLMGPLMVGVGLATGFKKHDFWHAIKDVPLYFLTGMFQGMVMSKRLATSIENKYERQIRFSMGSLGSSLPNIKQLMNQERINKIEHELLTQFLGEGYTKQMKEVFLSQSHDYKLITVQSGFLTSNMHGSLGHHAILVYSSEHPDGTLKKHHLIEIGDPSDEQVKLIEQDAKTGAADQHLVNQRYVFSCNGQTLLNMFVMHELLNYPVGALSTIKPNGFRVGYNDCHAYVDSILAATGEKLNCVTRTSPKDNVVGKAYVAVLEKYGVFSSKPQMGRRACQFQKTMTIARSPCR